MPILPMKPAVTPAYMVKSAWLEHGPFAFWVVNAVRPRLVVELGSHRGYSFCCFCEQVQRDRTETRVVAIDTWKGDDHTGAYGDEIYESLHAYTSKTYPGFSEMKRMYFSEALSTFADGSIDLLHVDGRHYYEDVVEDFTSYIPKLSDRAVVLFHDTQVRDHNFGVYRYWAELSAKYPAFEFHHGNGLGVLTFGKNVAPAVKTLTGFAHDSPDASATRDAFAREGARLTRTLRRRRWLVRAKRFGQLFEFAKPAA